MEAAGSITTRSRGPGWYRADDTVFEVVPVDENLSDADRAEIQHHYDQQMQYDFIKNTALVCAILATLAVFGNEDWRNFLGENLGGFASDTGSAVSDAGDAFVEGIPGALHTAKMFGIYSLVTFGGLFTLALCAAGAWNSLGRHIWPQTFYRLQAAEEAAQQENASRRSRPK